MFSEWMKLESMRQGDGSTFLFNDILANGSTSFPLFGTKFVDQWVFRHREQRLQIHIITPLVAQLRIDRR
jgi:hypothetical protein